MKTRNKLEATRRVAGLIAIAIIALTLICLPLAGCKNDEPTDTGGTPEQPIDNITDNAGNQIPIYKTDGVSPTDAATAVENIKKAWNYSKLDSYRNILFIGINKIYLLAGDSVYLYSFDKTTGILKVGTGWTFGTYSDCFEYDVYQALTKYTLSFPTEENPNNTGSVTITSDDQFTATEWKTLCDKVVTAIMRGYNKILDTDISTGKNKQNFQIVFAEGVTIIILPNSASYNCEVKGDDYRKMYLKLNAIDTVDLQPAIKFMVDESGVSYHQP